jgi:hypothetical protein
MKTKKKICKLYIKWLFKHKKEMNEFLKEFPSKYWNRNF